MVRHSFRPTPRAIELDYPGAATYFVGAMDTTWTLLSLTPREKYSASTGCERDAAGYDPPCTVDLHPRYDVTESLGLHRRLFGLPEFAAPGYCWCWCDLPMLARQAAMQYRLRSRRIYLGQVGRRASPSYRQHRTRPRQHR